MDKRLLTTLLLCMGVVALWMMFIQPMFFPRTKPVPAPVQPSTPGTPTTPVVAPPAPTAVDAAQVQPPITLESERFRAVFNNVGAVLDELWVKHENEWIQLIEKTRVRPSSFYMKGVADADHSFSHPWHVVPEDTTKTSIKFRTRVGSFEYSKHFKLSEGAQDLGTHMFALDLYVKNLSGDTLSPQFQMYAFNGIKRDSDYRYESYLYGIWGMQSSGNQIDFKKNWYSWTATHDQKPQPEGLVASALRNRYFALVLMPHTPQLVNKYWAEGLGEAELREADQFKNIKIKLETTALPLAKNSESLYRFQIFAGPARPKELAESPRPIGEVYDPSGFDVVCNFLQWILNFLGGIFGNYGVAIIFTTLFIRVCLFYLNKQNVVTMTKMAQLSPRLEALKAKYADDPQKLSQEQWKLWREEKVNPLAGCLPMFLQLPIFIGMYSVLEVSLDLRHASFFLWIQDLSEPDRLINFGRKIFWEVESFNLLPILMTIVWFIQSMMAPKSKDPQMQMNQKMMQYMPILFGVMCYNLASGLSWYFLINALLGMAEQKIIKKYFLPRPSSPAVTKAGGA